MGLDMYLEAENYISAFMNPDDYRRIATLDLGLPTSEREALTVSNTVAYWRKANAIHQWFVTNVQEGRDECQRSHVSREQLTELRDLCVDLLKSKDETRAKEELPPGVGFFFGGTEIDEHYWTDLQETVDMIDRILAEVDLKGLSVDFYYRASW